MDKKKQYSIFRHNLKNFMKVSDIGGIEVAKLVGLKSQRRITDLIREGEGKECIPSEEEIKLLSDFFDVTEKSLLTKRSRIFVTFKTSNHKP